MSRFFALATYGVFVWLLFSCAPADRRTSVLWTDVPEITGPVEQFNAVQKDWQIRLVYQTDLSNALQVPGVAVPDLVIGRYLASSRNKSAMSSLDFVFSQGPVTRESFYRDLLAAGTAGADLRLLPLSFNLPVLVYSTARLPGLDPASLSLDRVRELSREFAAVKGKTGQRLAFSPHWEAFSLTLLRARGVVFGENFQGELSWDSAKLAPALDYLSEWMATEAQGTQKAADFTRKYLSTSAFPLLREGRILFYPTTLTEFLTLPVDERRGLDFRFVQVGTGIETHPDILWAGIPSGSQERGAAKAFLQDFLRPERQQALARWVYTNEFRTFGVTGGLSSLPESNRDFLQLAYPSLADRLPATDTLQFWPSLPDSWPVLAEKVLLPWLADAPPGEKAAQLQEKTSAFGKPEPQEEF